MDSMTYLDFAENDYKYFMHSYESGYVANNMAANAQNTAEKYLKHLIDQYDHDEQRLDLRTRTLRTHNLSQLMNYLSNEMGMEIPLRVKRDINALNNYYFNARYLRCYCRRSRSTDPGTDSQRISVSYGQRTGSSQRRNVSRT